MNFPAFTFLISLFFSSTIWSCNKGNGEDVTKDTAVTKLDMKNVSYGSDTAQKLDVYLPENRDTTDTKVILFIHGGSWIGGDKSEFNEAIAALAPKLPGYAIFNMNYRLASNSQNRFPTPLNDIQSAIRFIESKASEYKVNANKLALVGASAGAHLALLHAYKNNGDQKIKAVVDLFGPADLTDLYNNHPVPQEARYVLMNLLGKTASSAAALYQQASPINFINEQTVPTCIFHGSNDFVVPIAQSNALKAKLLANNVRVEMTSYALEGHGWYGKNLLDTYTKTIRFIKENVN
jgi:acetyl esterase/lipase